MSGFDIKKELGTDKAKEQSGVWVDLKGKARILVARWGNLAFRELPRRKTRKHDVAISKKLLSEEVSEKILVEVMANTILLGWENIFWDGVALSYTVDNAIKALSESRDFRDIVAAHSEDAALYKDEADEAIAKNSPTASHGS